MPTVRIGRAAIFMSRPAFSTIFTLLHWRFARAWQLKKCGHFLSLQDNWLLSNAASSALGPHDAHSEVYSEN